jgi:hypothetical protein
MVRLTRWAALSALPVLAVAALTACGDGTEKHGTQKVDVDAPVTSQSPTTSPSPTGTPDPKTFVRKIDNPYFPLVPGTTYHYEGTADNGRRQESVVEVTHDTRRILDVETTVVRDRVSENGDVVEETRDFYAQDRRGTVWYFGEEAKELRNGEVVGTEGSWQAGRNSADPGIVMEAHPKVGDTYRQEGARGVAEDTATVLSLDRQMTVPQGTHDNVLQTRETSPLEKNVVEQKFYARNVGLIRELTVRGGENRLALVSIDRP